MTKEASLISFLSRVEPFCSLPEGSVADLAASMTRVEVPPGEVLIHENEPARFACLILEGTVSVKRSDVELLRRGAGEWVGEVSLIDQQSPNHCVEAVTDVALLKIPRQEFERWLKDHPGVMWGVARMLAGRIRSEFEVQQSQTARLNTLMDASKLINSSIETDEVIASILAVARRELGVERGTLYFVDQKKGILWAKIASGLDASEIRLPIGQGLAGTVAETGDTIVLHDAYSDPRFDRTMDERSGFQTKSVLCVPIKNQSGRVVGVLQLLNKRYGKFDDHDLSFLKALSDNVAIAMENAMLHLSLMEKERMQKELQLAREIQGRLLPAVPEDVPQTRLLARSIPCYEVGGDYYEFLQLENGDLVLAIGDASGKGVGAALVMSSLQAALRMAAPLEDDLAVLAAHLNSLLHGMITGYKYVTFFIAHYNPSSGRLRYVNAGHQPPLILSSAGARQLDATGTPIGLIPGRTWKEGQTVLESGEFMLLYTDGLTEATRADDEEFGIPRIKEVAMGLRDRGAEGLVQGLLDAVAAHEAGLPAADDKTVVLLQRLGD